MTKGIVETFAYNTECVQILQYFQRGCSIMISNNLIPRLPEIDSALQFISEIIHQLTNQKASIVDDIHSTFDELQKTLNVRKSVLLMELEVNYGLKHKVRPSPPSPRPGRDPGVLGIYSSSVCSGGTQMHPHVSPLCTNP